MENIPDDAVFKLKLLVAEHHAAGGILILFDGVKAHAAWDGLSSDEVFELTSQVAAKLQERADAKKAEAAEKDGKKAGKKADPQG